MSAERDFESPTEAGMLMPITRRPQNVFRDENEVHTIPRSPEKSSAHNHYFASTDVAESCESCESSQSDTITRSDDVLDGHEYKTRTEPEPERVNRVELDPVPRVFRTSGSSHEKFTWSRDRIVSHLQRNQDNPNLDGPGSTASKWIQVQLEPKGMIYCIKVDPGPTRAKGHDLVTLQAASCKCLVTRVS
ncbi:hypothetical protein EHS25_001403 [Saitozyma podzolica]|uniref:Uncharacterized protein n=1 Tax=Saitozyma podzolica TaxID=1890683 RepID=A0A427YG79_9TREE|nr:hypothetical protein EHS25_001403 [Saitozyma podzolica]